MLLVIIFGLVSLLALAGIFKSLKSKNILGLLFAVISTGIFGWFTVMTLIHNGFPVSH
ncbi:Protein of unknown function [Bacillus sp. OV322]|uniref:DUF2759 domain-containing protein n=1 Tax=Bacillus sp. OV322 TaxID=1882764 RepID=UPI0008EF6A31|nr:DUF2759 domain-containing protein [Bacillus sp. OV322]SFC39720.1 Protein of unknown function [Bacillus sp. OV322]